jgi:sterol desaturase/sphingolipid hydroxylase (fatty acid hydroxylase superfamily)
MQTAYLATLLGFFMFFAIWEGGAPRVPFADPKARWMHVARNLGLFAVLLVLSNAAFVAAGSTSFVESLTLRRGLLTPLALSVPMQIVAGILLLDLYEYAWHRLCHRVPWLWRLHRVHHAEAHLDVSTGMRFHPIEVMLSLLIKLCLLGVLGLPLWVEAIRAVINNPIALSQHANVRFPGWFERWARWLVITPALHRVHHSTDALDHDLNFGELFSWWDRLFGTYRPASTAEKVGLNGFDDVRWHTSTGMLASPLRAAPAP